MFSLRESRRSFIQGAEGAGRFWTTESHKNLFERGYGTVQPPQNLTKSTSDAGMAAMIVEQSCVENQGE